jgi:hypothetical protein
VSRGALVVGVDLSTHTLHGAALPLDPTIFAPVEFRASRIEQGGVADRLRSVRAATHHVMKGYADNDETASVWVEQPPPPSKIAMRGHDALVSIFGAVCSNTPKDITACAALMPTEWRDLIGLTLAPKSYPSEPPSERWKRAAIERVRGMEIVEADYPLNEHEAEATLIAIAGRALIWKHDQQQRREMHAI